MPCLLYAWPGPYLIWTLALLGQDTIGLSLLARQTRPIPTK